MEGADDDCALSNAPHKEPTCWLHSFHALPPRRVAPGGDPLRISIAFDAALPRAPEVAWTADDRAPRSVVRTRAYAGPRPPPGPDPPDWSCGRDGTWLRDFATHGRRGLVVDDLVKAHVSEGPPRDGAPMDEVAARLHLQLRARLEVYEAWMLIAAMPAAYGLHPRVALLDCMQ